MEGVRAASEAAVGTLVVDARLEPSAEGDAERLARERQQRAWLGLGLGLGSGLGSGSGLRSGLGS
eukprot:scaffold128791_cov36-Phaeocystis_antarctica.AAC.1